MTAIIRIIFPAFIRRDWAVAKAYRASLVLQVVGLVGSLATFFFIGRLVDAGDAGSNPELARGYFPYVVVGLAVLVVLQAGLTSFATRLREDQVSGTLEALFSTPISPTVVVVGSALFEMVRATLLGIAAVVLAIVFFGVELSSDAHGLAAALVAFVGCVLLISALGVVLAAVTIVFKRAQALLGFVVAAVALLSGIYYPLEVLPAGLEAVASALPFTWGLDALRAGLLSGEVEWRQLGGVLAAAAVALPVALLVFGRAVDRARRDGSLTDF